jgi:hypothetical protein
METKTIIELLATAVEVTCEKRERENFYSDAVVRKHDQKAIQTDWTITAIKVNGVNFVEWLEGFGLLHEQNRLNCMLGGRWKTKKEATERTLTQLEYLIPDPDWSSSKAVFECHEAIVASLQAGK